jgi:succinyl-diaminopimelate desuccinylase
MTDVAGILHELLAIASPTGHEGPICDHIEAAVVEAADRGQPLLGRRHGDAVVVHGPRRGGHPHLVLVGHVDTVPIVDGLMPPTLDGDRLTGRGAVDMKAGVAVMVALLRSLDLAHARVDLSWVFYPAEEGSFASNGLGELLRDGHVPLDGDLYLVLEPTRGGLELGCVGSVSADVTFLGQAAHAARPWQGRNAISRAGGWLQRMHGLTAQPVVQQGLEFMDTFAVTLARGGIAQNVVPDEFVCRVNHRFAPGVTVEQATERLADLCGEADRFEVVDAAGAGEPCPDNPVLVELRDALALEVRPKQAWTDVARLAAEGLDAVNFGPGDNALAHQQDEWISVASLRAFYRGLADFLAGAGTAE